MPLLAACGGGLEPESPAPTAEPGTQQSPVILGANRYGVVTGGIYNSGAQPLSDATSRAKFFCEMKQLNAKWLRIEAAWPGVSTTTYQQLVADAHANGLKVIVLYTHPQFCGDPNSGASRDAYISDYVTHKVNWWTYNVFNTTKRCANGTMPFRVEPNTFAWAVRRVKGNFGLRNGWNGSTHYPSKWEPWHELQKLAKGLTTRTGDSPDACWL